MVHDVLDGGVRRLQEFVGALGCKWHTLCQFKIRVANEYTDVVTGLGLVKIVVNHGQKSWWQIWTKMQTWTTINEPGPVLFGGATALGVTP